MKPIDTVKPTVPSNWLRRVEDRKRRQQPEQSRDDDSKRNQPPDNDPDGRTHIIDELA
jgi:hypothetical protein